jgi:Uma2 family endonuclease
MERALQPRQPPQAANFVSSDASAAGAERVAGAVWPAPQRTARHGRAVQRAAKALAQALAVSDAPLAVVSGRSASVIAGDDVLKPDIAVVPAPSDGSRPMEPLLVCEVLDRGSLDFDLAVKLDAWRGAPTVAHALWIDPDRGAVLHMRRRGGRCAFRFYDEGVIDLDALGAEVDVRALAAAPDAAVTSNDDWDRDRGPFTDLPLSGWRLPRFDDVDDFLAWYEIVPGKQRFELVRGAVRFGDMREPMPIGRDPGLAGAQRLQLRQRAQSMLHELCGPGQTVLSGGLLVAIGPDTALCPDLAVVEGSTIDCDASFIEPVIVVEILTPASAARDATVKLDAYLGRRGLRWIVLVDPSETAVMVYEGGKCQGSPRLVTSGSLLLPPLHGALDVAALMAEE